MHLSSRAFVVGCSVGPVAQVRRDAERPHQNRCYPVVGWSRPPSVIHSCVYRPQRVRHSRSPRAREVVLEARSVWHVLSAL